MNSPTPIQPGDPLPLHATREERFEVTDGVVYVMVDEHDVVMTPGDSITIPAGAARRGWNAGEEVACVVCQAGSVHPLLRAA